MKRLRLLATILILASLLTASSGPGAQAQADSRYFPETGATVHGRFLQYWQQHGGLAQFGYPLSGELQETSPVNGQTYIVQYFERAEFELHPENQSPYDVLLTPLGTLRYNLKHPGGAAEQLRSPLEPITFSEAGMTLGGDFRSYWQANGGLMRFGYPISNEFGEFSDLDGKFYRVQYFERAVMELHPPDGASFNSFEEQQGKVMLVQLGRFRYEMNYKVLPKLPLIIPTGATEGPYAIRVSGTNIVWQEDTSIHYYDLLSQNTTMIKGNANLSGSVSLAGPILIWNGKVTKPDGSSVSGIVGLNLINDETINVYGGSSAYYAAIFGQRVAWTASTTKDSFIVISEIGQRSNPLESHFWSASPWADYGFILKQPAISDSYIVWADIEDDQDGPVKVKLYQSNGEMGAEKVITSFTEPGRNDFSYALYRDQLALANPDGLFIFDLRAGTSEKVMGSGAIDPTINGDYLAWVNVGPQGCEHEQCQIWGMKRSEGVPKPLIAVPGDQTEPIIDSDLLVYHDYDGIHVTSVAQMFTDK